MGNRRSLKGRRVTRVLETVLLAVVFIPVGVAFTLFAILGAIEVMRQVIGSLLRMIRW